MLRTLLLLSLCAVTLGAQNQERRATLKGGGGDSGKCTIEVRVDGAADVEIRGDRAFIRNLAGQPAEWRRFECSGPIPLNPVDFRFRGIDGRGSQQLVRDPRSTGGTAVVRIEDRSGGAEGYTFDLEWRGESGLGSNGSIWDADQYGTGAAVSDCQAAVRDKAYQQYGSGSLQFRNMDTTAGQGRRESISGTFDLQRGNTSQSFGFTCLVNTTNGRVRSVDVRPLNSGSYTDNSAFGTNGISGTDDISSSRTDCERAVKQQIRGDGYRNIEIGSVQDDGRSRNQRILGTAKARRGDEYRNFDFSCSVNPNNGQVRAVQVDPR